MATWLGTQGAVKISSNTAGNLRRWSLNMTQSGLDTTAPGNTWRTRKAGLKDASGSFTCHFDKADTVQTAVAPGATVALILWFDDGTDAFSGNVLVTGQNFSGDVNDQLTEAEYTFANVDNTGIVQAT